MSQVRTPAAKRVREITKAHRVSDSRKGNNNSTMAGAAQVSPDKPLTEAQKIFAKRYAEGDAIGTAMKAAGYNEQVSYGYRLIKQPNIKREIAKYRAAYAEAAQLSRKDVMDMLKESYEMAKLMSEPATMVSAAREIGKMCGYYEPTKIQVDVNLRGQVKFEQLSDQELFAMIEKAAKAAEEEELALLEAPETGSGDEIDPD
jgi:phage terminase small subunit